MFKTSLILVFAKLGAHELTNFPQNSGSPGAIGKSNKKVAIYLRPSESSSHWMAACIHIYPSADANILMRNGQYQNDACRLIVSLIVSNAYTLFGGAQLLRARAWIPERCGPSIFSSVQVRARVHVHSVWNARFVRSSHVKPGQQCGNSFATLVLYIHPFVR